MKAIKIQEISSDGVDWVYWACPTKMIYIGSLACILHSIEPCNNIDNLFSERLNTIAIKLRCDATTAEAILSTYRELRKACESQRIRVGHKDKNGNAYVAIRDIKDWMSEINLVMPQAFLDARDGIKNHAKRCAEDWIFRANSEIKACIERTNGSADVPQEYLTGTAFWGLAEACCYVMGYDPGADGSMFWKAHVEEAAYSVFSKEEQNIKTMMLWWKVDALYPFAYAAGNRDDFKIFNTENIDDPRKWRIDISSFLNWCKQQGIELRPQLSAIIDRKPSKTNPEGGIDPKYTFPDGYLTKPFWRLGEACCYLIQCIIFQTDEERQEVEEDLWRLSVETNIEEVDNFHRALFTENGLLDLYTRARIAGRDGKANGGFDIINDDDIADSRKWEIKRPQIIEWYHKGGFEPPAAPNLLELIGEAPAQSDGNSIEEVRDDLLREANNYIKTFTEQTPPKRRPTVEKIYNHLKNNHKKLLRLKRKSRDGGYEMSLSYMKTSHEWDGNTLISKRKE